jgi:BirA family biotin operon repressor/biotin-[acetyl-CoA-carboxylase] ligase
MISALSLAQAVEEYDNNARPSLKWPNDVLLNNAKLAGILLEKSEGDYMIVGVGVNIAAKPKKKKIPYRITTLQENGINCTAEEFLAVYLKKFDQNLELLSKGGRLALRAEWVKRACGIGQMILVCRDEKFERGIFAGIGEDMSLILKQRGKLVKVLVGDIFFENGDVR